MSRGWGATQSRCDRITWGVPLFTLGPGEHQKMRPPSSQGAQTPLLGREKGKRCVDGALCTSGRVHGAGSQAPGLVRPPGSISAWEGAPTNLPTSAGPLTWPRSWTRGAWIPAQRGSAGADRPGSLRPAPCQLMGSQEPEGELAHHQPSRQGPPDPCPGAPQSHHAPFLAGDLAGEGLPRVPGGQSSGCTVPGLDVRMSGVTHHPWLTARQGAPRAPPGQPSWGPPLVSSGQTRNGSGLERRGSSHRGTRPGTKRPGLAQDCWEGLTAHLPPPARTLRFPRLLRGRERALKHRLYHVHTHRCMCTRTCTLASNPRHAVSCFSLEGPPGGRDALRLREECPGGSYSVLKEVIGFLRSVWISWESGFFHSVSYWASETLDSTRPPEQLHLSGRGPLALSRGGGPG